MKNKLSALEELRAERDNLRSECLGLESRIGKNIYYVRHNFWPLTLSTVFNGSRNAIRSLLGKTPSSSVSFIDNPVFSSLSTVWSIARPFVISWATKKFTNYLFGRNG